MSMPILKLTSYNTNFEDEKDFDMWTSFVADHIDEATGLEVVVEVTRFTKPEQFADTVTNATDSQRELILTAVRDMWDNASWVQG